jgi:mannosyltransferase OCH1-like enzyme
MEKKIHQVWLHEEPSPKYKKFAEKWQALHPDWLYQTWSAKNLPKLVNQHLYDHAIDFARFDCVYQMRADIVRYEILAEHGGFYCDYDTEPLKPIDKHVLPHKLWGAEYMHHVDPAYLGCEAHHPAMVAIVNDLEASVVSHKKRISVSALTGMGYITPYWINYDGYVAEQALWYPFNHSDVRKLNFIPNISDEVIAIHHWASQQLIKE